MKTGQEWTFAVKFLPWNPEEMATRRSASLDPAVCAVFEPIRRALRRDLPKETLMSPIREFGGSAFHVELVEDAKDEWFKIKNHEALEFSGIYRLDKEGYWGVLGKAFVFFLRALPLQGNTNRPHITIAHFPNGCDEAACKKIVADTVGNPKGGDRTSPRTEKHSTEGHIMRESLLGFE